MVLEVLKLSGSFKVLGSFIIISSIFHFLEGLIWLYILEVCGNNRSVMPLDVLGYTRATLIKSKSLLEN